MTNLPEQTYGKQALEWVQTASGERLYLNELECLHCGKIGCPYLAISNYGVGFWCFCSHECRMDGLRIGPMMEHPTSKNMREAGVYFISPEPDA